ncbi:MAG: hypothetical protein ABIK89_22980 [Planctomycetota bacterium]
MPVDWKRFDQPFEDDDDYRRSVEILLNCARYNLAWAPGAAEKIEREWGELTGREAHDVIRPACEASYALAVVLKTGIFDEQAVGVVEFEANRFLAPGYRVPYWNGQGGDTKAEENAWDSMIFHVAVAMMPEHPHVLRWKKVAGKLMASAYARKQDMQDETVLDGKPLADWLDGYNVREDGVVVNHGFFHPDYMTCAGVQPGRNPTVRIGSATLPWNSAWLNGFNLDSSPRGLSNGCP